MMIKRLMATSIATLTILLLFSCSYELGNNINYLPESNPWVKNGIEVTREYLNTKHAQYYYLAVRCIMSKALRRIYARIIL